MSEELSKHLWDMLEAIGRIEKATASPMTYEQFNNDAFLINGVERNFEIIGEALKRALIIKPDLPFSDIPKIIGMRNILAHNYDKVEPVTIWGTVRKNIPILKREALKFIKEQNEQ